MLRIDPTQRIYWLALAGSAIALELAALFFQYVMKLDPCVLCIYERVAIGILAISGLLVAIYPRAFVLRLLGYAGWAGSTGWGVYLAARHTGIQFKWVPQSLSCDFFANFPDWLKLDEWWPAVFMPTGYCDEIQWSFLSLNMPQWMLVIYILYLLVLGWVLVTDLRRRRR